MNQPYIEINKDICQACGACILDCPKKVISMGTQLNKYGRTYAIYNGDGCIGCQTCIRSCPSPGSITLYGAGTEEKKITSENSKLKEEEFFRMDSALYNLLSESFSAKSALLTGNEAILYGALLAGCDTFFGYPITPATEITELASVLLPKIGKYLNKLKKEGKFSGRIHDFLQAESEVAAINMLYGAASTGGRTMTATSGPGYSLMTEGISYSVCAQLPMVIANITRAGPGLGNISPSQADYNQMKASGHGPVKIIILAPSSSQEMLDFTIKAFDLAFKYRTPVVVTADGDIGHGKEKVMFPNPVSQLRSSPWAVCQGKKNTITSIDLDPDKMEHLTIKLIEKYIEIEKKEVNYEEYRTSDAELMLVGYGSVSRVIKDAINMLPDKKVGLICPKTLWPFPSEIIEKYAMSKIVKKFLVCELSEGQMLNDVKLAVLGRKPVHFLGRLGGSRISAEELSERIKVLLK
ncbi:MAG: 3-methyl-2-oxobutanoate dehydrogenase subunit VorB [archaeon]